MARPFLILLPLLCLAPAVAGAVPPWLTEPAVGAIALAPDGSRLAWARGNRIVVRELDGTGGSPGRERGGAVVDLAFLDRDTLAALLLGPEHEELRLLGPDDDNRVLATLPRRAHRRIRMLQVDADGITYTQDRRRLHEPDVFRFSRMEQRSRVLAANPGRVFAWLLGDDGRPAAAQQWRPAASGVSYAWLRRSGAGWYPVRTFALGQPLERLLRVEAGGWLLARRHDGFGDLAWLDPVSRELGKAVWRGEGLSVTGVVDAAPGGSPGLLAAEGRRPRLLPDDPVWAERLAALAGSWPGEVPRLLSRAAGGQRLLWRLESDRRPARFVLQDGRGPGREVLSARGGATGLAPLPREPFSFEARDGLELSGYLTRPPAGEGPPPAVVLVHGGPWSRDRWSFDPEARFLAGLGYAVVQVDFRGSRGHGPAHLEAGRREWGRAMQRDLDDAVAFAAERGWIDAGRVGLMGASYGGYAALMGVLATPGLYRCAVAWAPVTDLPRQLAAIDAAGNQRGYLEWRDMVGRPETLERVSPIGFRELARPALIGHGTADRVVSVAQSRAFGNRFPERLRVLEFDAVGHDPGGAAARHRWYTAVADFLAEELAPPGPAESSGP